MDARQKADLDRYITGNYGEDRLAGEDAAEVCPMHGCPLETYTINGGLYIEATGEFDTTPRKLTCCPECENGTETVSSE